jgi:hypothetical protein
MPWRIWFWVPMVAISVATPARAEFPVAISGVIGAGFGASWTGGQASGPFAVLAAGEVAWRQRPGRELTLAYQGAGDGAPGGFVPEYDGPTGTMYTALLLGMRRSRPGNGPRAYLETNVGIGWVRTELRNQERRSVGPALGGCAGVRIVPSEGGLGFIAGVRTTHVFTTETHAHSLLLLQLGLTLRLN